jgi:ABC-2 type transport system permease protein
MGSFASFGILGVVLFQLAVQVSQEQSSPWLTYVKTLPLGTFQFVIAKICASFVLSLFAAGAVFVVALLETPIEINGFPWMAFLLSLLIGGIPFALLGLLVGFLVKGKAVLPVANLLYLPLSFAGGLWLPPSALPKAIQDLSDFLPTRMYGEIIWAVLFKKEIPLVSIRGLLIYSLIFLILFWLYLTNLTFKRFFYSQTAQLDRSEKK